jgi:hypothetical protein
MSEGDLTAQQKTKQLLRLDLPVGLLLKNEENPNKMSPRAFDLLCDNFEQTGLTDAILVVPVDRQKTLNVVSSIPNGDMKAAAKLLAAHKCSFRIVGGHHRFDAAVYLGFEEVPVTVILDPEFDAEKERFQLVRMNVIRGKMDPQAFYNLYSQLADKYSDAVMQDAFGFAEEAEFKRLIAQTAKMLPSPELQQKFKEAASELKTVDGLSKLLNELFTKYGDTLPFGYMIFDHAGQRSMWLRIEGKTMNALDLIGTQCIDKNRTVDDVIGGVMQAIAKGEFAALIDKIVAATPKAQLPKGITVAPTKDNLEKVAAL